jgi:FkbM family methyltransferase
MNTSRIILPVLDRWMVGYLRKSNHKGQEKIFKSVAKILRKENILAKTAFGAVMRLELADYVQYQILRDGLYEPQTIRLIMTLLAEGHVFLDVGANVGLHTLAAASCVGSAGRVVALEPNPYAFLRLQENIELNGFESVEPILVAASNRTGLMRLAGSSGSSLGTGGEAQDGEKGGFLVGVGELAAIVEELCVRRVNVMKIDVEGQEARVIHNVLQNGVVPEHIIFEFFPEHPKYGLDPRELISGLRSEGYDLLTVLGEPYVLKRVLPENNVWAKKRQGAGRI